MKDTHHNLLNNIIHLELNPNESALMLYVISYYNQHRNSRLEVLINTSQNKLAAQLGMAKRTLLKTLNSLGHNVFNLTDIEKDTDPKVMLSFKITNKNLTIWVRNQFL